MPQVTLEAPSSVDRLNACPTRSWPASEWRGVLEEEGYPVKK